MLVSRGVKSWMNTSNTYTTIILAGVYFLAYTALTAICGWAAKDGTVTLRTERPWCCQSSKLNGEDDGEMHYLWEVLKMNLRREGRMTAACFYVLDTQCSVQNLSTWDTPSNRCHLQCQLIANRRLQTPDSTHSVPNVGMTDHSSPEIAESTFTSSAPASNKTQYLFFITTEQSNTLFLSLSYHLQPTGPAVVKNSIFRHSTLMPIRTPAHSFSYSLSRYSDPMLPKRDATPFSARLHNRFGLAISEDPWCFTVWNSPCTIPTARPSHPVSKSHSRSHYY